MKTQYYFISINLSFGCGGDIIVSPMASALNIVEFKKFFIPGYSILNGWLGGYIPSSMAEYSGHFFTDYEDTWVNKRILRILYTTYLSIEKPLRRIGISMALLNRIKKKQ